MLFRSDFSVKKLSSTTADALKILQVDNSSIFKEVTVQCHDLIQNTKEKMENEHNEKVKKYWESLPHWELLEYLRKEKRLINFQIICDKEFDTNLSDLTCFIFPLVDVYPKGSTKNKWVRITYDSGYSSTSNKRRWEITLQTHTSTKRRVHYKNYKNIPEKIISWFAEEEDQKVKGDNDKLIKLLSLKKISDSLNNFKFSMEIKSYTKNGSNKLMRFESYLWNSENLILQRDNLNGTLETFYNIKVKKALNIENIKKLDAFVSRLQG